MTATDRAMCDTYEARIRELEDAASVADGLRLAMVYEIAKLKAENVETADRALRLKQCYDEETRLRRAAEAESERLAEQVLDSDSEVTRLRNAMGDVRGMQSDGATPEEMDHALGRALRGLVPRVTFDAARSRAGTDEEDRTHA